MLPNFGFTLIVHNHIAELQRHAQSQRLARASYPDRERTPRVRKHWANR